ncbi:hypothetical protein CYY_001850 [Polysphondylium violaceum]|uniref:THH1/TOM1/TOM3 domain-containing protein n=1 Tax=Polysphondylium violaceum TaxID=133409 RepID=A0A8J4Q161_9MYCE|nr:hypothetical protein CYY_001850 [Polysphondylium violaceum]
MQLFYTFFLSEEIRLKNAKFISNSVYVFVSIYFCWQVIITSLCLTGDYKDAENVGFIVFFIFLFVVTGSNGILLLRAFKTQRKKSKVNFELMIKKTKILISGMVICVVITVVHDSVIMFDSPYRPYNFPLSVLLTGVADMLQLIVVMYVLADGKFHLYFTFKRVKTHGNIHGSSNDESSANAHKLSSVNINISTDHHQTNQPKDISIDIDSCTPQPHNDDTSSSKLDV